LQSTSSLQPFKSSINVMGCSIIAKKISLVRLPNVTYLVKLTYFGYNSDRVSQS